MPFVDVGNQKFVAKTEGQEAVTLLVAFFTAFNYGERVGQMAE